MRKLFAVSIVFLALGITAMSQECPVGRICLTPEQARIALENADKVKALEAYVKTLEQAQIDYKAEISKVRIEYAEKVGENTALKQNDVSNRAIITVLLQSVRPKKFGLINF